MAIIKLQPQNIDVDHFPGMPLTFQCIREGGSGDFSFKAYTEGKSQLLPDSQQPVLTPTELGAEITFTAAKTTKLLSVSVCYLEIWQGDQIVLTAKIRIRKGAGVTGAARTIPVTVTPPAQTVPVQVTVVESGGGYLAATIDARDEVIERLSEAETAAEVAGQKATEAAVALNAFYNVFAPVATYEEMREQATGDKPKTFLVAEDEKRGLLNTQYAFWPPNTRTWGMITDDDSYTL